MTVKDVIEKLKELGFGYVKLYNPGPPRTDGIGFGVDAPIDKSVVWDYRFTFFEEQGFTVCYWKDCACMKITDKSLTLEDIIVLYG